MTLGERLNKDLMATTLSGEAGSVDVIRLLLAAMRQARIDGMVMASLWSIQSAYADMSDVSALIRMRLTGA